MDGLHINSGSVLINTKRHGQRKQNRNLSANGSFECSKQSILSSMDKFVRTVQSMRDTILVPSRLRDMRLRPRLPDCKITLMANASTGRLKSQIVSSNTQSNLESNNGQLKSKPLTSSTHSTSNHSHFHHHLHHHLLHNHHLQDYHLSPYRQFHSSPSNSTSSLDSSNASRLNYDPAEIPSALMNADLYNFYSMLYDVKQQLLWGPASGQSTIYTNYSSNSDQSDQSNNSRFMMEKSALHQLNSTMANCNLTSSDNSSLVQLANQTSKENRAESTCSSGYSSNYSSNSSRNSCFNSTTNLSFIAQCNSPTSSSLSPLSTRPPSSAQTSIDETTQVQSVDEVNNKMNELKMNDSAVSSSSSTTSESSNKLVDSPQSKTPQSDSDLESELGSDSILTDQLTDRTSEPITDQTQLLASAFRHHLQALHTILDQLTHSAEYLSRNYELDLGEDC